MTVTARSLAAATSVAVLSAVGALSPSSPPQADPRVSIVAVVGASSAVAAKAALTSLPVKGRAAKTGYTRAQFGTEWADVDRNGCDTRNDVLRRDLRPSTVAPGGCVVLAGRLSDPYTGAILAFTRGSATSSQVQIDHVVPLADAWVKGAKRLSPARRTAFANDPLNLLATTGVVNDKKGSGDAATWLPAHTSFRCAYVARQIAVKRSYGLWITVAEHLAMARVLATCPAQPLPTTAQVAPPSVLRSPTAMPTGTSTPTRSTPTVTTPTLTPTVSTSTSEPTTTSPTETSTSSTTTDPRFATCAAAKAAGYGPYYRGRDLEYYWYRDADSDGIDCE